MFRILPANLDDIPKRWRGDLVAMAKMPRPRCVEPDRWDQLCGDAVRLSIWVDVGGDHGWSPAALFGVDPHDPNDRLSLAIAMRGQRVVNIFRDERNREVATIKTATGWRHHYQRMPDDAPLVWAWAAEMNRKRR